MVDAATGGTPRLFGTADAFDVQISRNDLEGEIVLTATGVVFIPKYEVIQRSLERARLQSQAPPPTPFGGNATLLRKGDVLRIPWVTKTANSVVEVTVTSASGTLTVVFSTRKDASGARVGWTW